MLFEYVTSVVLVGMVYLLIIKFLTSIKDALLAPSSDISRVQGDIFNITIISIVFGVMVGVLAAVYETLESVTYGWIYALTGILITFVWLSFGTSSILTIVADFPEPYNKRFAIITIVGFLAALGASGLSYMFPKIFFAIPGMPFMFALLTNLAGWLYGFTLFRWFIWLCTVSLIFISVGTVIMACVSMIRSAYNAIRGEQQ